MPRLALPLVPLTLLACGDPFTVGPNDAGRDSGALDTGTIGPIDAAEDDSNPPSRDATTEDAQPPHDAATKDDGGEGKQDGSIGIVDAGLKDAAVCARTCPAGFDCLIDKCVDRAAVRFSTSNNNPFNWSYGFESSLATTFVLYSSHWSPGSNIDVWTNTTAQTLEPSVFHNNGLSQQGYDDLTIPGGALGLYAGATNEVSVVRWTAPAAGAYAIDATFTGISTPLTTVEVGVLVNNITGMGTSAALNSFGGGNTFTYSAPAQMLSAGAHVDFYVWTGFNRDDSPGGVTVDARITE